MNYLPIFMEMQGRLALVVGGSKAAAKKADLLIRVGARVLVVDPDPGRNMRALIDRSLVDFARRKLREQDLNGANLIIAASVDETQNHTASELARTHGLPVNVVDRPALCSFIMPAFVDRSPMIVAISSGGTSPVLARLIRAKIEALLPQNLGLLAGLAQAFRNQVSRRLAEFRRRRFWEDVLEGDVAEQVYSNDIDGATDRLQLRIDDNACQAEDLCEGYCQFPQYCRGRRLGEVWLVGVGPGDPDLLTLKAIRLMQRCDVVLHDRLVSPAILDRIRRDADVIDVGKAPGGLGWHQDEINNLMIDRAQAGSRVLRLKSGDPMVFGRGGEELDVLRQAGIHCSIVPGITAGLAAASELGIALTDRRFARQCIFTNGRTLVDTPLSNLVAMRSMGSTLLIYMARPWLSDIRNHLLKAGFPASTPTVFVSSVSQPNVTSTTSRLDGLTDIPLPAQKTPSLLIVGDTINLMHSSTDLRSLAFAINADVDHANA